MTVVEVRTTVATLEEAREIASTVVKEELCAGAHIDQSESFYRWKGDVENAKEYRVTMQCKKEASQALQQRIRELHSYEEPAIYVFDIVDGSDGYLQWIRDNS
jgi:periplasmic divalent cation tolerance protein